MPWDRLVLGYHGCDRSIMNDVLTGKQDLRVSRNDYDWLGNGIYFRKTVTSAHSSEHCEASGLAIPL
jgi:hypothetical protein